MHGIFDQTEGLVKLRIEPLPGIDWQIDVDVEKEDATPT